MTWSTTIITFFLFSLFLFFFILALFVRYRKRKRESDQLKTKLQEEILKAQIEIQEQTFKDISQEIHDNVGQLLSLVKLNLATIPSTDTQKLSDTKDLVTKAIHDIRDLSKSLYGNKILELGLKGAIEHELTVISNSGKFSTKFDYSSDLEGAGPHETILFRIVQEILNNAIKHSKARLISVSYTQTYKQLDIIISDNGVGFNKDHPVNQNSGIGLKSMEDRAYLIGATLQIESGRDAGTVTKISYPVMNVSTVT